MALGFKYFHSGQPGAPVLTGEVGKMIQLLDWVLDVGDGAVGWEKVFVGANKAVYRPRHGVRYCFRVNDSGHLPSGARDAEVRSYESMTDVDTGLSGMPLVSSWFVGAQQSPVWRKSNSIGATARSYYGIKTAAWLVLWICSDDTPKTGHMVFVGQVPSQHPIENYPWVMAWSGYAQNGAFSLLIPGAFGGPSAPIGGAGQVVGATYAATLSMSATTMNNSSMSANSTSAATSMIGWQRSPSGSVKAVSGGVHAATWSYYEPIAYDNYRKMYQLIGGAEVKLVHAEALSTDANSETGTLYPRSYFPNVWSTAADLIKAGWAPGDKFTVSDRPGAEFVYLGVGAGSCVVLEVTDTDGAI